MQKRAHPSWHDLVKKEFVLLLDIRKARETLIYLRGTMSFMTVIPRGQEKISFFLIPQGRTTEDEILKIELAVWENTVQFPFGQ